MRLRPRQHRPPPAHRLPGRPAPHPADRPPHQGGGVPRPPELPGPPQAAGLGHHGPEHLPRHPQRHPVRPAAPHPRGDRPPLRAALRRRHRPGLSGPHGRRRHAVLHGEAARPALQQPARRRAAHPHPGRPPRRGAEHPGHRRPPTARRALRHLAGRGRGGAFRPDRRRGRRRPRPAGAGHPAGADGPRPRLPLVPPLLAGPDRLPRPRTPASEKAFALFLAQRTHPALVGIELHHNKIPGRVDDGRGLVTLHPRQEFTDRWWDADDRTVTEQAVTAAAAVFPGLRETVLTSHVSRQDPALVVRPPGGYAELRAFNARRRTADPRLQLAGDYFGPSSTYGALRSGEQAAARILSHLSAGRRG
ncbi:protein of unknown function [Streptomyces sp. KY75]|nr:protein of unknown function [Streptomyces sp. KY70]CAD5981375.1 protein of unknown function [Streptomyces sp. KY75]